MKVFFVYTIAAAIFLIISLLARRYYPEYDLIPVRFFIALEFILLSIMYFYILENKKIKQILIAAIFFYIAYWTFDFVKTGLLAFDFMPIVIECFFFTLIIMYYFYEIMRHNLDTPLFELASFWISVAFLIYFSGTFFLFLYSKTMLNTPGFNVQYLLVLSIIVVVKDILLCIAIFVNKNSVPLKDNSPIPPNLNLDSFQPLNNQN